MKFTYANIMSTIAMFAAVTTGTSYAAATLAKDSVRTAQIKNGQVTLADLHPTVKKRLGVATKPGGGGTQKPTGGTARPGAWANAGVTPTGAWTPCTASCGEGTMGGYHAGPHVEATPLNLGNAKTMNARWTGSLTNTGPKVAHATILLYTGNSTSLPSSKGYAALCATPFAGIAPGQTLQASEMQCSPRNTLGAYRYARTRVDLLADDNTAPTGLTSTITLEVQPVS